MADQDTKTELSKEVLAPPQEVREDLVATAVKFLQNPKVTQSPVSQKKAFLQRKGLTLEEIELAIQRSGVATSQTDTNHASHSSSPVHTALQPPAIPSKHIDIEVSRWMKARDLLTMVAMLTGISYAAYKLYKEFLRPWLFGEPTMSKRLDQLEKVVSESVTTMSTINTSLLDIDKNLRTQQEKLQMLSHDVNSKTGGQDTMSTLQNSQGLNEIKTELTSIKGLLLNRRQFPSVPVSSPVLPAWQLTGNAGDANSNNKGKQEEPEVTGAQVTFTSEPMPDKTDSETPVAMETTPVVTETKVEVTEQTVQEATEDSSQADVKLSENGFSGDNNDLEESDEKVKAKVKVTDDEDEGDSDSNASLD